ncbi:hypothetical protein [Variovorax ginsengisoli]|uniref:DUF4375 domain-containing protein n=1 Tax=Variovorax ginsengisoli TaxID=363844 RepID=A0ABT8SDE5_9BURK|nr:hypothetical protein [Variovorax ginsengisoli]MDN8617189.1 hypothetical protein [Variovorax ginsengisoli]MDO1536359.1 hypothetical protein [Variovorax ginsengisoli]
MYEPEQLKAADNGVHLCANCADLIDKDPGRYSVPYLQGLQQEAERRSRLAVLQPGGVNRGLLTSEQAHRVSTFIDRTTRCLFQLVLYRNHSGWVGYWPWLEANHARSFSGECAHIRHLAHPLCANSPHAVDIQVRVVESVGSLFDKVSNAPWHFDETSAAFRLDAASQFGAGREQANAAGELADSYRRDIYRLTSDLGAMTNGGSGRLIGAFS